MIQRVPPHAWDSDSPCDGWCARDVVSITVIGANAEMLRSMGLMGDPIDVPANAPAMARFLGLNGRDPNR